MKRTSSYRLSAERTEQSVIASSEVCVASLHLERCYHSHRSRPDFVHPTILCAVLRVYASSSSGGLGCTATRAVGGEVTDSRDAAVRVGLVNPTRPHTQHVRCDASHSRPTRRDSSVAYNHHSFIQRTTLKALCCSDHHERKLRNIYTLPLSL